MRAIAVTDVNIAVTDVTIAVTDVTTLSLRLMGLGGQGNKPSAILPEKNPCALYRKLGDPHGSNIQLRGREYFFP